MAFPAPSPPKSTAGYPPDYELFCSLVGRRHGGPTVVPFKRHCNVSATTHYLYGMDCAVHAMQVLGCACIQEGTDVPPACLPMHRSNRGPLEPPFFPCHHTFHRHEKAGVGKSRNMHGGATKHIASPDRCATTRDC